METQQQTPVIANADAYATDFYAWCLATAHLVRTGQWEAIDPEALAEELESLGKSQQRELETRVEGLLMHLLKWVYQSGRRLESHSWYDTIREHRNQIARLLRDTPSLKPQVAPILTEVYPEAREWALGEMTLYAQEKFIRMARQHTHEEQEHVLRDAMTTFAFTLPPLECPWKEEQILDKDFWPGP